MSKKVISSFLADKVFAVEINYALSIAKLDGKHINDAVNTVKYKTFKNVATIFVDGVMYKKDISNVCISVASYDKIKQYIHTANEDNSITDIIFCVDTPGGSVAGVDALRQLISNSPKKTHTIAENMMCSAGMWAFTESDYVYAEKTALLGSIGVIMPYREKNTDTLKIVSKNARNKVCDMKSKECKQKAFEQITKYESIFLDRLSKRYNVEPNKIVNDFNEGSVIFADEAYNLKYIDGVMTYDMLLDSLATMPPDGKIVNQKNTKETIQMKDEIKVSAEDLQKLSAVEDENKELKAKLENSVNASVVEAVVKLMPESINKELFMKAVKTNDILHAENIILKHISSANNSESSLTEPEEAVTQSVEEFSIDKL